MICLDFLEHTKPLKYVLCQISSGPRRPQYPQQHPKQIGRHVAAWHPMSTHRFINSYWSVSFSNGTTWFP